MGMIQNVLTWWMLWIISPFLALPLNILFALHYSEEVFVYKTAGKVDKLPYNFQKKLSSCSNGNDIPLPAETSEGHNSFSKLTVNILAWKLLAMTIEVTFIITIE